MIGIFLSKGVNEVSLLKEILWYMRSDIRLKTTTIWDLDRKERIDGFYFQSKRPFSRSYQWHATVGLENTYKILSLIQSAMKEKKKGALIEITGGMGRERVVIWKDSLAKAESLIFEMIREIQQQY